MTRIIAVISEWIGVFLNLQALFGFLVGLIVYKGLAARKQYHLRKMLSLNGLSDKCFLYIPTYIADNHKFIGVEDFQSFLDVNLLLSDAGIKIKTDLNERDITCGEIQIGGPCVNKFCNKHINYYLKDFQIPYYSSDGQWGLLLGDTFYSTEESDWAILVKIIDKSDIPSKSIHLLFGCGLGGSVAAVDYFTNHYSSIYQHNKSRPYIGVFAANERGERIGQIQWHDIRRFLKQPQ